MGPCASCTGPENCTSSSSRCRTFSSDFKINEWEILANLGSSGLNIQNVARDLIKKLLPALCSQSEKQVAVKVSVSKCVCRLAQVSIPFLHPSSFWRSAYQSGHLWRQCICQNEELIEQFWSQADTILLWRSTRSNEFTIIGAEPFPWCYTGAALQSCRISEVQTKVVCFSVGGACVHRPHNIS